MILAVLRIAELVDKELNRPRRWTDKAKTAQMTHLLSRRVIQSIGQVDFMVEEGGLGDGGRHDGDLSGG